MAEKKRRRGRFPLILGLILLITGLVGAHMEENVIQYAVRAPVSQIVSEEDEEKKQPNDPLLEKIEGLDAVWEEMEGSFTGKTAYASASGVSLSTDQGGTAETALHAVNDTYFDFHRKLLMYGRLIYPEEFRRGDRVIVLDEDLAIKLFMISDPTGRMVTLNGSAYRIVGVTRHRRTVGEIDLFGAYVPLESVRKEKMDMDMLIAEIRPAAQSGALSAFSAASERWAAGGCVYDLDKEAMRSGMPVRFVLCAAALYFLLAALRKLTAMTLSRVSAFCSDMRLEYARVLAPKLTCDLLILAAGFALTIAALGGLVWFSLQPVYVFPEWIPAVLVEWEDINATFWNLTKEAAKPIRCLTQEMIRMEFWTRIARWGLMAALFGWAAMTTDGRKRTE
ncbi:MAG: ABC transporter permease [Clostridia bacterium]|nr:ABC transporter permease [Clostridia bacterium]